LDGVIIGRSIAPPLLFWLVAQHHTRDCRPLQGKLGKRRNPAKGVVPVLTFAAINTHALSSVTLEE
jgi:hypothetical protein